MILTIVLFIICAQQEVTGRSLARPGHCGTRRRSSAIGPGASIAAPSGNPNLLKRRRNQLVQLRYGQTSLALPTAFLPTLGTVRLITTASKKSRKPSNVKEAFGTIRSSRIAIGRRKWNAPPPRPQLRPPKAPLPPQFPPPPSGPPSAAPSSPQVSSPILTIVPSTIGARWAKTKSSLVNPDFSTTKVEEHAIGPPKSPASTSVLVQTATPMVSFSTSSTMKTADGFTSANSTEFSSCNSAPTLNNGPSKPANARTIEWSNVATEKQRNIHVITTRLLFAR